MVKLEWFQQAAPGDDLWVARVEHPDAFECEACVEEICEVFAWYACVDGVTLAPRNAPRCLATLEEAKDAAEAWLHLCLTNLSDKATRRLQAAREALGVASGTRVTPEEWAEALTMWEARREKESEGEVEKEGTSSHKLA
jgi:hypothetical protein